MKIKKYLNGEIMNYEQKYNKLVEAVKVLQEANPSDEGIRNWVNDNVPELKESEDEKIRKELVKVFSNKEKYLTDQSFGDITVSEVLAWLEKQGKQKPTTIDIDKMVDDYANNKERGNEEFGKPVYYMIRAYRQGLKDAIGKVVLKPTWSEEDEENLDITIAYLKDAKEFKKMAEDCIDWLKSLKERIGG